MWTLLLTLACTGPAETDDSDLPDEAALVVPANDRDYAPAALALVEGASERVHVVEYVIYDSGPVHDLLVALADAADRGVDVAILADEEGDDTAAALAWLADQGVRTALDTPHRTTHNKLIIGDDQVLVGSHNFTSYAMDHNHEASALVREPAAVAFYEDVFQALWDHSNQDVSLTAEPSAGVTPLADGAVVGSLEACLAGASERVRLVLYAMVYSADYPNGEPSRLVRAVADAHGRGVDVGVILDDSEWIHDNHINDDAADLLREAGVSVWNTSRSVTTHAKVLVCDDTVIVSDANWSYSGLTQYHGTSVAVQDAAAADAWVDYYQAVRGE